MPKAKPNPPTLRPLQDLIRAAIQELQIDVPIMHYEQAGNVLLIYLYGGQVIHYPVQLSLNPEP